MTDHHERATEVTAAQARQTALVVAGVLAAVAAWSFYRGRSALAATLGAIAVALVGAGLFVPRAARLFHTGWMRLAVALGYVNSRILLTLMFYGVFAPYGLVSKLFRRDPLRRRQRAGASHWIPRKTPRQSKEQFERLF